MFFDPEIAAELQFYTLPLEVVGLSLALIEVRFPGLAARIHASLVHDRSVLSEAIEYGFVKTLKESRLMWVTVAIYGLLVGLTGLVEGWFAGVIFLLAGVALIPILAFLLRVQYQGWSFITSWVPDRSVGTIGVLIAALGVTGEAYQLTTQVVT